MFVFFPKKGGWGLVMWSWGQGTHFLQRFFDVLNKHRTDVRTVSPSLLLKRLCWYSIVESAKKQTMWVSSNSSLKIFLFSVSVNHPLENMSKRTTFAHKLLPIQSHHFVYVDLDFFRAWWLKLPSNVRTNFEGLKLSKRAQDLFHGNSMTILFSLHMAHDFILEVHG